MKHLFFISVPLAIIFFGSACNNTRLSVVNNKKDLSENIQLLITPADTTITKELILRCKLVNSNETDVAIPDRFDITTIEGFEFVWYAEIYFKERGKQKKLPPTFLGNLKLPAAEEYIIINPGEIKEFNFTLNFDKLGDKTETAATEYNNTDYGEYTIKLIYKDTFCKHKLAIKGQIESNTINVTYKK